MIEYLRSRSWQENLPIGTLRALYCDINIYFYFLERAGGIGRLGISYGVGMVLGPLIGGFVTERFDEQTAAATAAFGSLVSMVLVFLFIPNNTKALLSHSDAADKKGIINRISVFSVDFGFIFLSYVNKTFSIYCTNCTNRNNMASYTIDFE